MVTKKCLIDNELMKEVLEIRTDTLFRMLKQDEGQYISMYREHNTNLAELMKQDREVDMAELDKAWTAANPET